MFGFKDRNSGIGRAGGCCQYIKLCLMPIIRKKPIMNYFYYSTVLISFGLFSISMSNKNPRCNIKFVFNDYSTKNKITITSSEILGFENLGDICIVEFDTLVLFKFNEVDFSESYYKSENGIFYNGCLEVYKNDTLELNIGFLDSFSSVMPDDNYIITSNGRILLNYNKLKIFANKSSLIYKRNQTVLNKDLLKCLLEM
jgi:hypothetical protein